MFSVSRLVILTKGLQTPFEKQVFGNLSNVGEVTNFDIQHDLTLSHRVPVKYFYILK